MEFRNAFNRCARTNVIPIDTTTDLKHYYNSQFNERIIMPAPTALLRRPEELAEAAAGASPEGST